MVHSLLWLLALGPLALVAVGSVPTARADGKPFEMAWWAFLAGCANIALAVLAALLLIAIGPIRTDTAGVGGIGFSISLDALSAIVLLLVAFVGTVVIRFSRNYMAGDSGQGRFIKWLALTLAAVLVLILSGNLFQFILAWIGTSVALNRLLLFYRERPSAILAARKKFVASRLADAALIGAAVILLAQFGTLDHADLRTQASALVNTGLPGTVHLVAILLVLAALLKSAQFPLHGWLLEVMETPTPVSALLHAGVINAGGYLLLRHADIIALSAPSLDVLVLVGGFTALFGSVVMLTQTSVKVSLAWSTIAQMGFMMLQIGLGAFSAALLHIVAHSLYKAHAFLSSGSVIDLARASWTPSPGGKPHPGRLVLSLSLVLATGFTVATLFGATLAEQPGVFALSAIVVLGLSHLVVNAVDERLTVPVLARTVGAAALVAAVYFTLQAGAAALTAGALPPILPLRGAFDLAIILMAVVSFAAVTVLQSLLPFHAGEPRWQALYAHVANGFYVNTLANRLVLSLWPVPAPRSNGSALAQES